MRRTMVIATLVIGLSLLFSVPPAAADLVTINFNDLDPGPPPEVVTTKYSGQGVVFSAEYFSFPGEAHVEASGFYGDGIIIGPSYCNAAAYYQADFSVAVDFVSVEFYPFESGDFVFGLELYDSSDGLVGSMYDSGPFPSGYDPTRFVYLEAVSADPNVAYARFYGYYGLAGVNAAVADNFTFGTCVSEPATSLLLFTGLIGLAGLRRKFKK